MIRIRIVVADRDFHLREVLLDLLAGQEDMKLVGEARKVAQVLHLLKVLRPDVLLLDEWLPGGMGALPTIAEINPATNILVLADRSDHEFVLQALEQGARGCISRVGPPDSLVKAIRVLHRGELWATREVLAELIANLLHRTGQLSAQQIADPQATLTDREQQIFRGVASGMTNKEVAKELEISDLTVKTHLQHIYAKLGVHRRLQIILEQTADHR